MSAETIIEQEILSKWVLSCGNHGIEGEHNATLFSAFWGVGITVKLGTIIDGVINSDNVTNDEIKLQLENYLKKKSSFSQMLTEYIPHLMSRLHFHDKINEEFVTNVAISNINNDIPTFYICDHCHINELSNED